MANRFQLFIYRFSTFAPLAMIFALIWYLEKQTVLVPVLCLGIGLLAIIMFYVSFMYARKHLSPIGVNVIKISPNDRWIIGYILSYLLPFISMPLNNFSYRTSVIIVIAIIAIVVIATMLFVNSASPNPLLSIVGYHFYSIGTKNGLTYLLISKRKLRNKTQVQSIKRLFEYLLIDEWR